MREQAWFNLVAVTAVLVVLAVGGLSLALAPKTPTPTAGAASPSLATVYRNLSITYDPATQNYNYNTRGLSVPMDVQVVFTITNYDPTVGVVPAASAAVVSGTFGGPMLVHLGDSSARVSQLPVGDVSHTFSMSDGFYHLNVPIPPAASLSTPSQVTFSVEFTTPGTFSWGCVILCGSDATGMPDEMYGLVTIG